MFTCTLLYSLERVVCKKLKSYEIKWTIYSPCVWETERRVSPSALSFSQDSSSVLKISPTRSLHARSSTGRPLAPKHSGTHVLQFLSSLFIPWLLSLYQYSFIPPDFLSPLCIFHASHSTSPLLLSPTLGCNALLNWNSVN